MPGTSESKNDHAPSSSVNLTDIESFSFLFNAVWQTQQSNASKVQLNLLDAILFHDGVPYRWLFTSCKTGEIMKKKDGRLCYQEVIKSFRSRTSILNENKGVGPVATVWYVESTAAVKSNLVNEKELLQLFESEQALNNVLAIQVYLSGSSLKGSGVFEHRILANQDGKRQHQTIEFASQVGGTHITTFSEGIQRGAVTEAQHNSIKDISRRLVKAIENSSRCTVASIVVQVAFDASWTPHVVAARNIILWSAPSDWYASQSSRNSMIYASGSCPEMCNFFTDQHEDFKHSEEEKSRNQLAFDKKEALKMESQKMNFSLSTRVLSSYDKSALKNESINLSAESSKSMSQTEQESNTSRTSLNQMTSVASIELGGGSKKKYRNRTQSIGESTIDFFKMLQSTEKNNNLLGKEISPEPSDDEREDGSLHSHPTSGLSRDKLSVLGGRSSVHDLEVVGQYSPSSDAEADLSLTGHDDFTNSGSIGDSRRGELGSRKLRSPQDRQGESSRRLSGLGLGSGSGSGPGSVSGACCQGGYCLQASYAGDRDGSGLRSKERRRSHGSRVGTPVCPFQMAFKSVLLDRAEEKLLGSSCKDKLREDILACDGKMDHIVLAFARTRIQRVAELIKEQAKDAISVDSASADSGGHSLQYYYHKMVYNEALAQVPLNRFYQPVSICDVCYKMYGYLDHVRGEAFMKDSCTLPDITRHTSSAVETHNPLKTRSQSFTADSEILNNSDMTVDADNLRRSKSSSKMNEPSATHEVGNRRILKGGQERFKPYSSHESPTTHKTRVEGESRFCTPQRSSSSTPHRSSSSTPHRSSSRHQSDRKEPSCGSELQRFLSTPGPTPRSAAPLKPVSHGTVDLGPSLDRMSVTSGSQRGTIFKSRSEFSINDSSSASALFEAYKTAKSRHQLTGADRLSRGKSANIQSTTGFVAIKPLSYRVDKSLEPYSAPVGPGPGLGPRSTRPLNIEQSKGMKRKEEGWNQCHHVVQEHERQLESQKRIDTVREQRVEQLKLLHISYDQVKEQRIAKEEKQRQRRLQLVQREREKKQFIAQQQTQLHVQPMQPQGQGQGQGQSHQQTELSQEKSKTKSRILRDVEKAAKKELEDMERHYLLEQYHSGDEEEKVQSEKDIDDEEAHETLILLEQIHQNQGKLQQELEQHLALEVEQESKHVIRDSEQQKQQQQQQQQQVNLINSQKEMDLQRSRKPSLSNLEVQIDEPHRQHERVETAVRTVHDGTVHERKDDEALQSAQGGDGAHHHDKTHTQDHLPTDPGGEEENSQSMGSKSNSFRSGAFRPQSAAYLIAQREACQGSLETSISFDDRDKGKVAFSPGPSPLKSTLSKSPVIGVGIPMQSQYYLGESDSFADFHPRKAAFAHHPFTPVLESSNDEAKQALEDLSPTQTPAPMEGKEAIAVCVNNVDVAGKTVAEVQGQVQCDVGAGIDVGAGTGAGAGVLVSTKAFSSSSSSSTLGTTEESSPSSSPSPEPGIGATDQGQVLKTATTTNSYTTTTTTNALSHTVSSHLAAELRPRSRSGSRSVSGTGSGSEGQLAQVVVIHTDEKSREIDNIAHSSEPVDQEKEIVDAYDDDDFIEEESS